MGEYFVWDYYDCYLQLTVRAGEESFPCQHLCHDATNRPFEENTNKKA